MSKIIKKRSDCIFNKRKFKFFSIQKKNTFWHLETKLTKIFDFIFFCHFYKSTIANDSFETNEVYNGVLQF